MADSYELTKLAAECHRAKWQFDVPDNAPKSEMRRLLANAFDTLHRIGDQAINLSKPISK